MSALVCHPRSRHIRQSCPACPGRAILTNVSPGPFIHVGSGHVAISAARRSLVVALHRDQFRGVLITHVVARFVLQTVAATVQSDATDASKRAASPFGLMRVEAPALA